MHAGVYVSRGSMIGGALGFLLIQFNALLYMHKGILYLVQAIVSIALLYVPMPAPQHKLAWTIVTISISSSLEQGMDVDRL